MRVLCTLPNASELINGVVFVPTTAGLLSDELTEEQAARFLKIPGYQAVTDAAPALPRTTAKPRVSRPEPDPAE